MKPTARDRAQRGRRVVDDQMLVPDRAPVACAVADADADRVDAGRQQRPERRARERAPPPFRGVLFPGPSSWPTKNSAATASGSTVALSVVVPPARIGFRESAVERSVGAVVSALPNDHVLACDQVGVALRVGATRGDARVRIRGRASGAVEDGRPVSEDSDGGRIGGGRRERRGVDLELDPQRQGGVRRGWSLIESDVRAGRSRRRSLRPPPSVTDALPPLGDVRRLDRGARSRVSAGRRRVAGRDR